MEDLYILVISEPIQDSWFRMERDLLAVPGGEPGLLSDSEKDLNGNGFITSNSPSVFETRRNMEAQR